MIRKQDARDRINELLRLDGRDEIKSRRYTIQTLTFIRSHLTQFIDRYGQQNGLTLTQASQSVNSWDIHQWQNAVNNFDMSQWPQSALNRIKAVGAYAAINKGHLITGIALMGLIANSVKNHRNIVNRLARDGSTQVKHLKRGLDISSRRIHPKVDLNLKNWEKNFWADNDKLGNDIEDIIRKNLRRGYSVHNLDRSLIQHYNKEPNPNVYIGDRLGETETSAERILRTESSRLIDNINMETYKVAGVKLVDSVTMPGACQFCIGIQEDNPYSIWSCPNIPYHPNCRCIHVPHHDSSFNLITPNLLF